MDYRSEENALYVRFKDKNGRFTVTARYDNVSPEVGFGLLNADSPGGYFHKSGLIKRRYTLV